MGRRIGGTLRVRVRERDLVIVGGGPAGMAAAIAARRFGVETTLVDEHGTLGGQIFKQFARDFTVTNPSRLSREYRVGRRLIDAAEASGAEILLGTVAW